MFVAGGLLVALRKGMGWPSWLFHVFNLLVVFGLVGSLTSGVALVLGSDRKHEDTSVSRKKSGPEINT